MTKLTFICSSLAVSLLLACGGSNSGSSSSTSTGGDAPKSMLSTNDYDPKRGEGKWSADNVKLGDKLDAAMAAEGKKVFDVKCFSCHKLTEEKLVGPGWKGVTSRQTAPWILNFISNPDPMIDKDPELQAQLEICLIRMTNQNLTDADARAVLEFMRQNDGVQ